MSAIFVFFFNSYVGYSRLCARLLRRALKPELREQALKAEESAMKCVKWENGKPTGETSELMIPSNYGCIIFHYLIVIIGTIGQAAAE